MKTPRVDDFTRHIASQVIYQIFPERFAIGGRLTSGDKLSLPAYDLPHVQRMKWNDLPSGPNWGNQFFGGDLDGITERLDYLTELGITGVYLTPVWRAPSNHKYDAVDFFTVDPMFGGEVALAGLRDALHQRGMSLTLDAVLNHISAEHPWFLAAKAGDPTKRDWFSFREDGSYLCWQDYSGMPELNLSNPEVLDVLYRQPDSLVQRWLEFGIDHWRFDVAQDVGIAVAEDMAAVVAKRFPHASLLGELIGFAGSWFEAEGGFHGMMNYWYRTAILAWLEGAIDAMQMNCAIRDARAGYGLKGLLCSWNMLSSHDTPRLLNAAGSEAKARLALLLQMTLPGVPLIYYGEEIGMEGCGDPECRRPMRWNEADWNHGMRDWVKRLIAIRQASPALQYGEITVLGDRLPGNAVVFLRYTEVPSEQALVVVNMADTPLQARLLLPYTHCYDSMPMHDALGMAPSLVVRGASVQLDLPPGSAAIYQPADPLERYSFFKERNR